MLTHGERTNTKEHVVRILGDCSVERTFACVVVAADNDSYSPPVSSDTEI